MSLAAALLLSLGVGSIAPAAHASAQPVTGSARIVTSNGSTPAVGAVVTASSTSSAATVTATVDADGTYSLALDTATTWTVCADEPSSASTQRFLPHQCSESTVSPSLTSAGPALLLQRAGEVTGSVSGPGLDVTAARLLVQRNGVWEERHDDLQGGVDSSGTFDVTGVPDGTDYRLCFDAVEDQRTGITGPAGCYGGDFPQSATPVSVQGGTLSLGAVTLSTPQVAVSGTVQDPSHAAVPGADVVLERQVSTDVWQRDHDSSNPGTDGTGGFTFAVLPATYRLRVKPSAATPDVAAYVSAPFVVSAATTLAPTVLPAAGTISGVLSVPTGESPAHIDVRALAGSTVLSTTTSATGGSYTLSNVPTGAPVRIEAASDDPSTALRALTVANVAVNSTQNLILTRGAVLSGTLVDSDVPNVNALVTAWDPTGANPVRTGLVSDTRGDVAVAGLTPGVAYDVSIDPEDGRQVRYVRDAAADVGTDPSTVQPVVPGSSLGVIDLSGLSGSVPVPATAAIGGTPAVGATLHVEVDGWSRSAPPEQVLYTWYAGDTAVTGTGTQNTQYQVQPADSGKVISVQVTGRLSGYRSARTQPSGGTAYTPVTTTPTAPSPTPTISVTRSPALSGTPKMGKVLVVNPGAASAGATASVQWLRNGAPIPGATRTSYKLGKADKGKRISVRVSYTRGGYAPTSRTTAATGPVR